MGISKLKGPISTTSRSLEMKKVIKPGHGPLLLVLFMTLMDRIIENISRKPAKTNNIIGYRNLELMKLDSLYRLSIEDVQLLVYLKP